MKKGLATGLLLLGLTGCVSAPQSQPQPETVGLICLPLVQYTQQEQDTAATEITNYGKEIPQLVSMLGDYANMRMENRQCIAAADNESKQHGSLTHQ